MRKRRTPPKAIRFTKTELENIQRCVQLLGSIGNDTNPHKFIREAVAEKCRGLMR